MTEETLKHLTIEGLYDLHLLSTKELLDSMERKDEIGIKVKKKQVELLQTVIAAKKLDLNRK